MHYVYLLQSESFADQRYVGMASDLKQTAVVGPQLRQIPPHLQIRSVEIGDLHCVLGRAESPDI